MPFHLYTSSTMKYSSLEYQQLHEDQYKKFLQNLQTNNNNLSQQKLNQKCSKNDYFSQRQMYLQSRQDKRKAEYERIQKENLKFSQKLINAKAFLNQNEQQCFFDKHCQLKQRLQRYPNLNQTTIKTSEIQFLPNKIDSSFFIYNDNKISLQDKCSKMNHQLSTEKDSLCNMSKTQKKLPHLVKHNLSVSKALPSLTGTVQKIDLTTKTLGMTNTEVKTPSIVLNKWNRPINTANIKQLSSLKLTSTKSISSSTSKSSMSDLLL